MKPVYFFVEYLNIDVLAVVTSHVTDIVYFVIVNQFENYLNVQSKLCFICRLGVHCTSLLKWLF